MTWIWASCRQPCSQREGFSARLAFQHIFSLICLPCYKNKYVFFSDTLESCYHLCSLYIPSNLLIQSILWSNKGTCTEVIALEIVRICLETPNQNRPLQYKMTTVVKIELLPFFVSIFFIFRNMHSTVSFVKEENNKLFLLPFWTHETCRSVIQITFPLQC